MALASSGARASRVLHPGLATSAAAASTMRSGPPGDDASSRIATPLPQRSRRIPKPTGPSPKTPARTAHASRSSSLGSWAGGGTAAAGASLAVPVTSAPTGPAVPTPSTSAHLDGRKPHVGRAVPRGLRQVLVADDGRTGEIRDRAGDP